MSPPQNIVAKESKVVLTKHCMHKQPCCKEMGQTSRLQQNKNKAFLEKEVNKVVEYPKRERERERKEKKNA